jgi:SAM-dependent methyltransferase
MMGNKLQDSFYGDMLSGLLEEGAISRKSSVLVVCGGDVDAQTFLSLGFDNVTLCNLDDRMQADGKSVFAPYKWSFEDAESLTFENESFELVVVHSGLHHLRCPHKGILEMYRVASRVVLCIEPHDSWFTRLGVRLGFGQDYETLAVYANNCLYGGVANSEIPNFVYRFSSHEIVKLIQCGNPIAPSRVRAAYRTRVPYERAARLKNPVYRFLIPLFGSVLTILGRYVPVLANNVAFTVFKPSIPGDLMPWLDLSGGRISVRKEYLSELYKD